MQKSYRAILHCTTPILIIYNFPDFALGYNSRGSIKISLNKIEEGICDFDTAIALAPEFPFCYANRGWADAQIKRYEEAIADFGTLLKHQPWDSKIYCQRGYAKYSMRNYKSNYRL